MSEIVRGQALPKQPPHSVEAEQNVLGGLMLSDRAYFEIADRLGAEDFYRADHQVIYHHIAEMLRTGKPCDFVTLSEHLRNAGALENAGGIAYLGALAAEIYSVSNIVHYADIVRDRAVLRRLIAVAADISESGYRPDGRDTHEIVAEAVQRVQAVQDRRSMGEPKRYAELILGAHQMLEKAVENGGAMGLSTTLADLDQKTTGLHPGDLVVIAGRPSMGKTTLALQIAEHAARKVGPAKVFSMEMPAEQLAMRSLATASRVSINAMRSGKLCDQEWDAILRAETELRDLAVLVDDAAALSLVELRARAMRSNAKRRLSTIVVDYMQLMQVSGAENRTNEISEVSRGLKALAKELGIPVIALSQLNRAVEARDNKRPRMSDLRESGGIEQDADIVLFIYRDEVYNPESPDKGTAEIIVAKQRNGPLGMVRACYHPEYFAFENLSPEWFRDRPAPTPATRRGFRTGVAPQPGFQKDAA